MSLTLKLTNFKKGNSNNFVKNFHFVQQFLFNNKFDFSGFYSKDHLLVIRIGK